MSSSADQQPSPSQVFLSSRPPVTPYEAGTIAKILDALIGSETFYLSGSLDLATLGARNPTLLYSVGAQASADGDVQAARVLSLSKPSTAALDLLHADADSSSFGRNKELVHDESYRLARELKSDRFNLNFDPIAADGGVMAAVSAFAAPHLKDSNAGGHFKKHQDTPKAGNHIGTLLFGLPVQFSGGELVLSNISGAQTGNVTIDWSKPTPSDASSMSLPWVFFYSDVEHEILPVASGHRLTLAYDIFATDTVRYRAPSDPERIDSRSIELFNVLNAALKDEQFLNKGGKLAFALTYQYPAEEMERTKEVAFDAILKGNDYLLFHILKALCLTPEVRAVYQPEEFPDECQADRLKELVDSGEPRYPADQFSSFYAPPPPPKAKSGYWRSREEDIAFFTAPSFTGIDSGF
ncbi:hypothetical protein FRC00_012737, partial [Tulasnella sp. 408]